MQKEKVNTWNKKVSLFQKYNISFMQKLLIKGKKELSGLIKISGSKNATLPILAASILAKTHRDNYIYELVKNNPDLEKYGLHKHKGYGTKIHMDALR